MKKVDMVVDLQYGSTGKGLIAGYLAESRKYDVVVNANMPNAGHTYIDDVGQKMIHKVLPNGVVSPACTWALIGPGSVFSIDQLVKEIGQLNIFGYGYFIVGVHPNAVLLQNHHIQGERNLDTIGSTKQGSSEAMIEKIRRSTDVGHNLASNHTYTINNRTNGRATVLTHDEYRNVISSAKSILAEGAQGYSLGINQQFWPYCTSRECTPSRFASDMMIPLPMIREVIGVARVHPIRVGGTSGAPYPDQTELTWEDVGQTPELTTVTKKERRIFDFSYKQMDDAIWEMRPDKIFLNFVNYDKDKADEIIRKYGSLIHWVGIGPTRKDVIVRKGFTD